MISLQNVLCRYRLSRMNRPAHARHAVLEAAEAIVKDIGAANLTYDELVRRSGITRGGITYHFPTKESLLQALVEHDLQRWRACIDDQRSRQSGPAADLQAHIESGCEPDDEASRLCAGLLSATVSSKDLDAPWRAHFADTFARLGRGPDPDTAWVLALAVEGLFWLETLRLSPLSAADRRRVVARMRRMARDTAGPPASAAAAPRRGRRA
jgi:AcrR family transcriptional regulator